jgi:phosphoenolpyruvate synthase/pyruvate phosphate dikinase
LTILPLERGADLPADAVGGKARGLVRLVSLGLPVPDARIVSADVHERWLREGRLSAEDSEAVAGLAEALPAPLAVRSSATDEDVADQSAAGQYESVMGVEGREALIAAVETCYRAAESERARAYRGDGAARLALVVQHEVAADRAGVAFSVDPVTGAPDVVVEAVFGHGEGIVSGSVTPDRYLVGRDDGAVRARRAEKRIAVDGRGGQWDLPAERRLARVLGDHDVRAVAELVRRAEEGFERPVDVEFCFEGVTLWAVQCRPITTL